MRYLNNSLKLTTREMYEQIFDDSANFIDWYYKSYISNVQVLVEEDENDKIISMLHIIDKYVWCDGRIVKAAYIYAVCTDKAYRKRGIVKALLEKALKDIENQGYAFAYLIPVNPHIYESSGFCLQEKQCYHEQIPDINNACNLNQVYLNSNNYKKIAGFYMNNMPQNADVFLVKDSTYFRIQNEILNADNGNISLYEDKELFSGYISGYADDILESVGTQGLYCKNRIMYKAFSKEINNILTKRVFIPDEV
ncbi:MAG: GNAT family N-acetyltransferase [Eubacterium sp.]